MNKLGQTALVWVPLDTGQHPSPRDHLVYWNPCDGCRFGYWDEDDGFMYGHPHTREDFGADGVEPIDCFNTHYAVLKGPGE